MLIMLIFLCFAQPRSLLCLPLMTHAIFSNRFEVLYEELRHELCLSQTPFVQPILIVPSMEVRSYLIKKLAWDAPSKGILGLDILLPKQAIEKIVSKKFPDTLDFEIALGDDPDAKKLAAHFTKWSWYGRENPFPAQTAFQKKAELLWNGWKEQYPDWIFPEDVMLTGKTTARAVYLFGFSFLPKTVYQFFLNQIEKAFFLSPCMLYWNDILSDKEAERVEAFVYKNFEEMLFDRNPLLANLGGIGRKFSTLVEESTLQRQDLYRLKEPQVTHRAFKDFVQETGDLEIEEGDGCFLELIQSDLLLLQGKRKDGEKIDISASDTSVEIHSAPTLMREIEILYQTLAGYPFEEPLEPGDIFVFCPDIERYAPYIHRFFGASSSLFSYQIIEKRPQKSLALFTQTLLSIFSLKEQRYHAKTLFELFLCPAFREKLRIKPEDIVLIERLFIDTGFREGIDAKQKEELFSLSNYSFVDEKGTWKYLETSFLKMWIEEGLDAVAAKVLGDVIIAIRSLFERIETVYKKGAIHLVEWISFIETLTESYFFIGAIEKKELELYRETIELLKGSAKRNPVATFSFTTLYTVFEEALHQAHKQREKFFITQREVVFSSLDEIHLPSKIICLLGMNEGDFPRRGRLNEDRYLIIQACLHARKMLYISYQGFSFHDHKTYPPSSCVVELMSAIEEGYTPSRGLVTHHPLLQEKKVPRKISSFDFTIGAPVPLETVDVRLLKEIAKNPLKPYFRTVFQLSLSSYKEERFSKLIEWYDLASLERNALKVPLDVFFANIENHPKMPTGMLKRAIVTHLKEAEESYQKARLAFNIGQPLTIELSSSCIAPVEIAHGHYIFPSIKSGKKEIFGKIEGMYEGGYLLFERLNTALFRIWPELLIIRYLEERYGCFKESAHSIISLKEGKKENLLIQEPLQELMKFTSYAESCHSKPFCLYPEFIPELFQAIGPQESLDAYASFFLENVTDQRLSELVLEWQKETINLFQQVQNRYV